jgi:hypothetical protein
MELRNDPRLDRVRGAIMNNNNSDSNTIAWREAAQAIEPGNLVPTVLPAALEFGRHYRDEKRGIHWLCADLAEILTQLRLDEEGRLHDVSC